MQGRDVIDLSEHGRWSEPGFPHKGWEYEFIEDLEVLDGQCDVCGTELRYVHHLFHPQTRLTVGVGCICAEKLTEDYVNPKVREKLAKGRAARNARWLKKEWQPSAKGFTLKALGYRMTVFRIEKAPYQGMWGYFVGDRRGNSPSRTLNGAKVACRDLIDQLKQEER
ncbi:MAG: hypothetical protein CNCCGFBP_00210 [Fimbriimonadaceae bacterium]|nr:hypothetical protein [Fimbriimonadaceae bacterium]